MTSSRISLSRSLTTDAITYELTVGGDGTAPIDIQLNGRDAAGTVVDSLIGEIRPGDLSDVLGLITSTLTGLAAVHEPGRAARRKPNQGARWTADDDAALVARYREGVKETALMQEFGRTRGGIRARLEHLGEITPPAP